MVPQRCIIKRQRQRWKMNKHSLASLSYLHIASFCRVFGFYLVPHSPDTILLTPVTLFTLGRLPMCYEYGGNDFFRNTGSKVCVCVCVCVCVYICMYIYIYIYMSSCIVSNPTRWQTKIS